MPRRLTLAILLHSTPYVTHRLKEGQAEGGTLEAVKLTELGPRSVSWHARHDVDVRYSYGLTQVTCT